MALDLSKIVQENFPDAQYVKEETVKKQITLHHTVSGKGVKGDVRHWLNNPERVATCVIVAFDGTIHQCFSSKFWGHHLGCKSDVFTKNSIPLIYRKNKAGKKYIANNEILNENSIGIEIDSYGGLKKKGDKWYNAYDIEVDSKIVYEYTEPYRGYYGYEKYTDAQIQSVKDLLLYWGKLYNIPLNYNEDMFDVNKKALCGESGVWSHTSYRIDKSDIHPQKEIIDMLKSLK